MVIGFIMWCFWYLFLLNLWFVFLLEFMFGIINVLVWVVMFLYVNDMFISDNVIIY